MTPEYGLLAGILGCLATTFSMFRMRRHRTESLLQAKAFTEELEDHKSRCSAQMGSLAIEVEALSQSRANADDILREGRLGPSIRSQVLQLLRAGVAPETAAATLHLPCREVRLLGKVSQVLSTYR